MTEVAGSHEDLVESDIYVTEGLANPAAEEHPTEEEEEEVVTEEEEEERGIAARPSSRIVLFPNHVEPLMEGDFNTLQEQDLNKISFTKNEVKFLSHYLLYLDKQLKVPKNREDPIVESVQKCKDEIERQLRACEEFKGGKIWDCGSFYENTKVGDPHEFDYLYVMPLQNYRVQLATMKKTKAKHSILESKIFYNMFSTVDDREIFAWEMHQAFQVALEKILREIFPLQPSSGQLMLRKSGPAVKFVLNMKSRDDPMEEPKRVKVDVTLAIDSCRETFIRDVELHDRVKGLYASGNIQCHFVPAHDFWKLSFTRTEKILMEGAAAVDIKGVCYRAIKILRDRVDVKDVLGDGILSSYPIKVTHMKEALGSIGGVQNQQSREEAWTKENVGRKVIEVTKKVDRDGHNNQISGIFLRDDNILAESDRSYLECRRIIKMLKSVTEGFRKYSEATAVIWFLMTISSLGLLVVEISAMIDIDWPDFHARCFNESSDSRPPFPLNLDFLFPYTIFAWINMLTNVGGVILVFATFKWNRDIFNVLPNLKYIYLATFVASLFLVAFDIFLISDYAADDGCTHLGNQADIVAVACVTLFISIVPIILFGISFFNNFAFHRGSCKRACSSYEVFFFVFPFCRERQERLEEEEAEFDNQNNALFHRMGSIIRAAVRVNLIHTKLDEDDTSPLSTDRFDETVA